MIKHFSASESDRIKCHNATSQFCLFLKICTAASTTILKAVVDDAIAAGGAVAVGAASSVREGCLHRLPPSPALRRTCRQAS